MSHLPKPEFELDSLIFYFQGVLFLTIMSCFAYIIGTIIKDKISSSKKSKDN
jgi:hypothetical protein